MSDDRDGWPENRKFVLEKLESLERAQRDSIDRQNENHVEVMKTLENLKVRTSLWGGVSGAVSGALTGALLLLKGIR